MKAFAQSVLAIMCLSMTACSSKPALVSAKTLAETEVIQGFTAACNQSQRSPGCFPQMSHLSHFSPIPDQALTAIRLAGGAVKDSGNLFPRTRIEEVVRIGPLEKVITLTEVPFIGGTELQGFSSTLFTAEVVTPALTIKEIHLNSIRW